jgi:hypothetical protein
MIEQDLTRIADALEKLAAHFCPPRDLQQTVIVLDEEDPEEAKAMKKKATKKKVAKKVVEEEAEEEKPVDADSLRNVLKQVMKKHGKGGTDAAVKILNDHKAKNITDLDAKHIASTHAEFTKILNGEQTNEA